MANGRWRRRFGASAGLIVIVAISVVAIGGALAGVLALTVDDEPAEEQATQEAADVQILRCRASQGQMSARVRVTNNSSAPSDYFIDVGFTRMAGDLIETSPAVVEAVAPGDSSPVTIISAQPAPRAFDCVVGDVDRMAL